MLGMADQVNKLMLFDKDFKARQGVGAATAEARNPDGTIDPNRLSSGLSRRPETNWNALETAREATGLQRGQIGNVAAQFDVDRAMMGHALAIYGSLADNPNPEAINGATTNLAAAGIPATMLIKLNQQLLKARTPQQYQSVLEDFRAQSLGPAGTSTPTDAPPGPGLVPQQQTRGSFLRNAAAGGGAAPVGMPVGEEIPAKGAALRAEALQGTASTSGQYHTDLENLKKDSQVLENLGGPTFEVEKKLAQLSSRLGGLLPSTMTPEQLRAGESFDKIAQGISTTQAGRLGAATDAGRHMVVGSNPSTSMSAYGREGVIDMLQGNQDFVDAARNEWLAATRGKSKFWGDGVKASANEHDQFMHALGQSTDPRVFQFNRLNKENQSKFWNGMAPGEAADFKRKYAEAIRRNWVEKPK